MVRRIFVYNEQNLNLSALNTTTCAGTVAYMCTENKIPEKPFNFFFCLQVVLSLEDHSSEVQVVKHLLHILSPNVPSLPPHLIGRPGMLPPLRAP